MRKLILATLGLSLLAGAACKGGNSCEAVMNHMESLMTDEMKKMQGPDDPAKKKEAIAKCEKETTPEDRKCMMETKDMGGVMACMMKSAAAKGGAE